MLRPLVSCCVLTLLLLGACEQSPGARALELFPDRSRELAVERPFRRPATALPDGGGNACPALIEDVGSATSLTLRGWSEREERRREGASTTVTHWQQGYYVPMDPTAVGLAAGEEYVVRCDRLSGTGVNVPDLRVSR